MFPLSMTRNINSISVDIVILKYKQLVPETRYEKYFELSLEEFSISSESSVQIIEI